MTTTTTESRNETALARAVERWNAGDLAGSLEVYDDRIRLHGMSPEPMDKPAVRAFYEKLWAAFPGNHLELHETFGSGDRLVARFTLTGRHDGDFMGIPATGIRISWCSSAPSRRHPDAALTPPDAALTRTRRTSGSLTARRRVRRTRP
jgi:predicted ester cyclase